MTTRQSSASPALSPHDLLARIERRLEDTRTFSRDVVGLFQQLVEATRDGWHGDHEAALASSLQTLRLAAAWAGRCPDSTPRILDLTVDLALVAIARCLRSAAPDCAEVLVETLEAASVDTREILSLLILHRGSESLHNSVERHLSVRILQVRRPSTSVGPRGTAAPQRARDLARLQAMLRSRLGRHDDALESLEGTSSGDPRVLMTCAELHRMRGDMDTAWTTLTRAMIVAGDMWEARAACLDAALGRADVKDIVDALVSLLGPTGDPVAWQAVVDTFEDEAPDMITDILRGLREAAPGAWVNVLIDEHEVDGVVEAAAERRYAFEHLWKMADFLAEHDEREASKLYERAIKLEGSVARSRSECEAFADRVERALPFFERIGKPTRARRYAREVVKRSRNHVPLKRELERVLGTTL